MYMVEAGNGEGQIGAGGYYPSYEYYTMALDKAGTWLPPTTRITTRAAGATPTTPAT